MYIAFDKTQRLLPIDKFNYTYVYDTTDKVTNKVSILELYDFNSTTHSVENIKPASTIKVKNKYRKTAWFKHFQEEFDNSTTKKSSGSVYEAQIYNITDDLVSMIADDLHIDFNDLKRELYYVNILGTRVNNSLVISTLYLELQKTVLFVYRDYMDFTNFYNSVEIVEPQIYKILTKLLESNVFYSKEVNMFLTLLKDENNDLVYINNGIVYVENNGLIFEKDLRDYLYPANIAYLTQCIMTKTPIEKGKVRLR